MAKIGRPFLILAMLASVLTGAGSARSAIASSAGGSTRTAVPLGTAPQDYELGIPHAEKMILQLSATEQDKLKRIIGEKPVEEARSYLVTRYFLKTCKPISKLSDGLFDEADRKNIKDYFDIDYTVDFNEELDAMNALLFFGIDPVKGVVSKGKK